MIDDDRMDSQQHENEAEEQFERQNERLMYAHEIKLRDDPKSLAYADYESLVEWAELTRKI